MDDNIVQKLVRNAQFRWKLPAEPGAPVIEDIDVTVHRQDPMDGELPPSAKAR